MRGLTTHRSFAVGQGVLATCIRITGWFTVTALASLGIPLSLAFTIGSFSVNGTMHHVLNLAGRYVAAGPERQSQFDGILEWIVLVSFAGTGFFRRRSLKNVILQEADCDRTIQNG